MKSAVRTSLDIPRDLHRRLKEAAARRGCSSRQLVLESIRKTIESPASPRRRLKLDPPIVPSRGKPFSLTNAEIHDLVEFP